MSELLKREKMARTLFEVGAPPHQFWDEVGLDKRELYLCMADAVLSQGLSCPAPCTREPVAWEVWWGIGEMTRGSELFRSRDAAQQNADQIKSNTEVRPLYDEPASPADLTSLRLALGQIVERANRPSAGETELQTKIADMHRIARYALLPLPDGYPHSAASSDTARQLGMTDDELKREMAMAAFMSGSFPAASTIEPVAWQTRYQFPNGEWDIWRDCSKATYDQMQRGQKEGLYSRNELRPLYAAPITSPEPDAVIAALRELTEACEADCGVPSDDDEDDEAVGASAVAPMALTFGMLRRARAALARNDRGGGAS